MDRDDDAAGRAEGSICLLIHDDLTGWSSSDGLLALHDNEAIWLGIYIEREMNGIDYYQPVE